MIHFNIRPSSINAFTNSLKNGHQKIAGDSFKATRDLADEIYDKMLKRVPVRTGALRDSGRRTSVLGGTSSREIITFGGGNINPENGVPTSEYAAYVHEDPELKNPEGFKWMEKTMMEYKSKYLEYLAQHIKSKMGG